MTMKWWTQQPLWARVLVGLFLGVIAGLIISPNTGFISEKWSELLVNWLAFPGYFFLAMLKMIVVPLVLVSVMVGIAGSGTVDSIKRVGSRVLMYFAFTTVVAVTIGSLVAQLLRPGKLIDTELIEKTMGGATAPTGIVNGGGSFADLPTQLIGILPTNPFQAMSDGAMLQVVIFAMVLGMSLVVMPKAKSKPITDLLVSGQESVMVVVNWLMQLAPYAVFGLIAKVTANVGVDALSGLAAYVGTVIIALLTMVGFQLLLLRFLAGVKPSVFLNQAREAQLVAFSTSSSAATMPVTLRIAEGEMKVKPEVARFTVPLGTTINMDGTALYQAVATTFIAQVFGVELGLAGYLTVLLMAVGASIGSPGLPGASIPILASILLTVGIPPEGIALIIGVDRILDMCRTAVNVNGDLVVANVMNKWLKQKNYKK